MSTGAILSRIAGGAGGATNIGFALQIVGQLLDSATPKCVHSVVVTAQGDRWALKDDVFRVALSVATGIVRGRVQANTGSLLNVSIDHMNRVVEVTLAYDAGGPIQGLQLLADSATAIGMMRERIPESVTGGAYPPFVGNGDNENIVSFAAGPKHPESTITNNWMIDSYGVNTGNDPRSQNPQPAFDLGRTSDLTAIITAALSPPCCELPQNVVGEYPRTTQEQSQFNNKGVLTKFTPGLLSIK